VININKFELLRHIRVIIILQRKIKVACLIKKIKKKKLKNNLYYNRANNKNINNIIKNYFALLTKK